MPNFDGGHYFLTVLAPIRTRGLVTDDDGRHRSHCRALRDVLAGLPTAMQSPASEASGLNSPFARNRRTHLARFVVIDDVVYNGRMPTGGFLGAIGVALFGPNPMLLQPVDHLSSPYLLFACDFDAASGDDAELRSYAEELWNSMETELRLVFEHCVGFETVDSAADFYGYLKRCQIETTMPFNDYWIEPIPAKDMSLTPLLLLVGVPGAVTLLALLLWILGIGSWPWGWITLLGAGATVIALLLAYRAVLRTGGKPFPTAPNSDLPSVLKAIYLQQRFVAFATANQGADDATLHKEFGAFLAETQPNDLDAPTQAPGVIRS